MRLHTDVEDYRESMQFIDSDILDTVLSEMERQDFSRFSRNDVVFALNQDVLDPKDFAALLSPAADSMLERMAARAKDDTARHFGNSVSMFTPIYVSNHCENGCAYCGFNKDNDIHRIKLDMESVEREMRTIASEGLSDILVLTGESRSDVDLEYIGGCIDIAKRHFKSIGVEIFPLNVDEYRLIQERGVDYVTVFQETYDPSLYSKIHRFGPKRVFSYRFNSQERALMAGMRGVAFGALLGLGDSSKDAFACGLHGHLLQRRYPHAEISFSLPRLRPFSNGRYDCDMTERRLLQVALAYRIFMPFAGMTISTRERPTFRDNVVGLCATKISAGVSVGVGGHCGAKVSEGQFEIFDTRDVSEIVRMLKEKGLQPVMNDYVRV